MGRLDGKVALVTGGGEGIGAASAKLFAKEGAKVVIVARHPENIEAVKKEIEAAGGKALAITGDVRNAEDRANMVKKTIEWGGKVDILEQCAMTTEHRNVPFEEVTQEYWDMCFNSGLLGPWDLMRLCLPSMKENGYGRIINFGSGAGLEAMAGLAPYAAIKEGVRALTKAAAREWGKYGITANCVIPVAFTRSVKEWAEAQPEQYARQVAVLPLGRYGDPDTDIAPIILFLASDDSRFYTGQTVSADGFQVTIR